MNRFLLCSALLLLISAPLVADPEIPASAWEQHPEGVALAVRYSPPSLPDKSTGKITVYIKNISSSSLYYVGYDGFNMSFEIFYLDSSGKEVPGADYNGFESGSATNPPEIKPRMVLTRTAELNSKGIALLQKRLISCHLFFLGVDGKTFLKINSTPSVLIGK